MDSVCKFITAQQFGWWSEGEEGGVRGGRNGGGEAVGPALPALGPALAGNCNSSSGGKVSSAWLPLTSPKCLPLCSCLYPQTFCLTSSFVLVVFLFFSGLFSVCESCKLLAYQVVSKELLSLPLLSSISGLQCLHPTKWQVSQAQWGKYVSSPRFKISPPPW